MNEEEKESIEEFRKQLRLAINIDDVATTIRNDDAETILNLIEKLQKENEELKQDRNNNYQMIALAQNEMLGYMQGYEDGKKLKRSAVACVVENQQYYIMNKEIEHYKEYIQKLQKENKELRKKLDEENKRCMMLAIEKQDCFEKYRYHLQQNESLTKEFSNVIPILKIKDKIEELNNNRQYLSQFKDYKEKKYTNEEVVNNCVEVLQELLESE